MPATPSFLDQYIKGWAHVPPDETTPSANSEFQLVSTWGFETPSNDQTKPWLIGNTLQLIEGIPDDGRIWEVSTSFLIPGDSERIERVGRIVPAFVGDDLQGEMSEMGFGPGEWQ